MTARFWLVSVTLLSFFTAFPLHAAETTGNLESLDQTVQEQVIRTEPVSGAAEVPGHVPPGPITGVSFVPEADFLSPQPYEMPAFWTNLPINENLTELFRYMGDHLAAQGNPQGIGLQLSEQARAQMNRVIQYAKTHHSGASRGNCFNFVWRYLSTAGYGKIKAWGDLPDMPSGEARHFAEFMNRSATNLKRAGLIRLDTSLEPKISNPHDPRIPPGAVIVVAAGSTGTRHATAGDIVIKSDDGRFLNDGPDMYYGARSNWRGKLLGVYVPE